MLAVGRRRGVEVSTGSEESGCEEEVSIWGDGAKMQCWGAVSEMEEA